ncbi:MAG: DUF5706 domain-containing protein [Chitinophagaceae bacterium]
MNYTESLRQVSDYMVSFFTNHHNPEIVYHNQSHTLALVDAVNRITADAALDDRSRFIVLSAAWFYDSGYFVSGGDVPKNKSAVLASEFLKSIGADDADVSEVRNCITATNIPQSPQTETQKIICDAALYYLGTESFSEKSKLLRKETESLTKVKIRGKDWREKSIALFESHNYFTEYCQSHLEKVKEENLELLKKKQEDKLAEVELENALATTTVPQVVVHPTEERNEEKNLLTGKEKKKKKQKKKDLRPARGMEVVYRVGSTNHQRLSSMADNKAHIMISVNSIIISVVLGLIVRKIDNTPQIIIPTVILLLVNVVTLIFSVLATRPRVPKGFFTKEQVENKDIDLTFFGNYYKMGFKEYESGMKDMMYDSEFLHGSMIRNLYGQARVLGRKFELLRISYNVFMFGIAIAVLAYVVTLFINK